MCFVAEVESKGGASIKSLHDLHGEPESEPLNLSISTRLNKTLCTLSLCYSALKSE